MAYEYVAYTPQRNVVKGTLGVTNETVAVEALERAGLMVLSLREVRRWDIERQLPTLFRVKTQDVILFSRQLAMLLERGTGFLTALQLSRDQIASKVLQKILTAVITDVKTGSSFSTAIAKHPQAFPLAYSRMMRVGEKTGKLEVVLREVATYMEQDEATRKKVRIALTYPVFVVLLGLVTGIVLVFAVIPPLMHIFAEFNTQLPWPTRILLALGGFVSGYKFYLLGAVFSLALLFVWYAGRSAGRYQLERLIMKLPVIGRISLLRSLSHFSRITSILLGAGLPIIEVMPLVRQSVQSEVLRQELENVPKSLLQGQSLSQAMKSSRLFPGMFVQMVITGEETNSLDSSFAALADHYEFEFNQALTVLMSMLEPLLVVLVGLVVGFIAIAAMMPIYSIYDVMG
ncbi:MAG: type II secretion system F family protein [Dehalococcoidia bacterium]|nr:MAG: type II secretion system F family protein [Dehalococcoidia bacterium]